MRMVLAPALVLAVLLPSGCGDDDHHAGGERATVVVTTSVLGDVVENLVGVGGPVDVEVLMGPNVDPHDFQPSARQIATMREAALLVTNGMGFEHGLEDAVEAAAADGVEVFEAVAAVETDGTDPHVFTDPVRMVAISEALAEVLGDAVAALEPADLDRRSGAYLDELAALHDEVSELLATVPDERRVLVTHHDVLGYFAERYGFEVAGTIVGSTSTLGQASAAQVAELADTVRQLGLPAVFVEASSDARLAEALAAEVGGDVEVVELLTESLAPDGEPGDTYVSMVRTNAERIAAALGTDAG